MGKIKAKKKQQILDKNRIKETLREAKEMAQQKIESSGFSAVEIYNKKKINKKVNQKWNSKEEEKIEPKSD